MSDTLFGAGEGRSNPADAARAWWQTLATRERRLVGGAALLLVVVLTWMVAVQPAWQTLRRAAVERETLETQWRTMQRLAAEAQQLRAAPPVAQPEAVAALEAASARLGTTARLTVQGDRAVLTVNGVATSALRDWLAEARSGARARPIEATLSRGPQGQVGTVVVDIGGSR